MVVSPKRILWPTDFSPLSLRGGKYAHGFKDVFGCELHMLNVIIASVPKDLSVSMSETLPITPPEPEEKEAAMDALRNLVEAEFDNDQTIHLATSFGNPWARICKYAKENDIDMIILSTHGRTGIRHVLIGSTAERVVQHSPCPVLVIKDPERDFLIE